ncbi:hypothetical protein GCM10009001_29510 [Virgibacillus siamensis]|uniref:Uncharacterized protein n=1 Tax=Virgibacillus siamensis TaxID=480071 RepID=A0ABP3RH85_9BACI
MKYRKIFWSIIIPLIITVFGGMFGNYLYQWDILSFISFMSIGLFEINGWWLLFFIFLFLGGVLLINPQKKDENAGDNSYNESYFADGTSTKEISNELSIYEEYNNDKIDGVEWQWKWRFSSFHGKYTISNLIAVCDDDFGELRLIPNSKAAVCRNCSKEYINVRTDEEEIEYEIKRRVRKKLKEGYSEQPKMMA